MITSQAIGVNEITFGDWPEADDSAMAVIAEDGLSFIIGLQLNNGDLYGDSSTNQEIEIEFFNNAKTEMYVKLTLSGDDPHFKSITHPDPADTPCDDIHIWFEAEADDIIGQVDPWTYIIKLDKTKPMQPKDVIIDADGEATTTTGIPDAVDVTDGDALKEFGATFVEYVVADNLDNPTKIWEDTGIEMGIFEDGEPVILGNPVVGDIGYDADSDSKWTYHDIDDSDFYEIGEDIILDLDGDLKYDANDIVPSGNKIKMYVDVGNKLPPGFYTFEYYIEPTNYGNLTTANMDRPTI